MTDASTPTFFHKPVLVNEVLEYLNLQPGKVYLDVTFGSGGHSRAILEKEPESRLVVMDWDTVSLDTYAVPLQQEFGDRVQIVWGNFAHMYKNLKKAGIDKVDGILADFGTSQMQIVSRPGFSVYRDKPLDMRMSPSHQRIAAGHVLQVSSEEKLREIFWQLGEERYARQIARAIVADRNKTPFRTTGQLADLIERVTPPSKNKKVHPATRVFQALRMYINKELDNIHAFLPAALNALNPDGRLVCISFHSLEDREVKNYFREQSQAGRVKLLTKKVVTATPEELAENRSSRSAKLRAVQLID